MEIKEIKEKLDFLIAKKDDVIINDITIFQPFRYITHNDYIHFYRGKERLASLHKDIIRDIY